MRFSEFGYVHIATDLVLDVSGHDRRDLPALLVAATSSDAFLVHLHENRKVVVVGVNDNVILVVL